MPIMEVVLEQEYFGQRTINRFNYLASGTPAATSYSAALIIALGAVPTLTEYPQQAFCSALAGNQNVGVSFVQIGAKDIYNVIDFFETPFGTPLNGVQPGDGLPPFNAWGLYSTRTRTDIRRGMKRFVGCTEDEVDSGGIVSAARFGGLQALAGFMTDTLEYDDEGQTLSFTPIVVGKQPYEPEGSPGNTAYRYYPTEAEQLEHIAQSIIWAPYTTVRSQTSRQYGRGI